jgi:hypothetical protein
MKRRKPPIALVSALLICVIAIGAMTFRVNTGGDDKVVGDKDKIMDMPTKDDLVQHKHGGLESKGPDTPASDKLLEKGNQGPTLLVKKPKDHKEMPSDNSVQSGWFTPEAHQQEPK